MVQADILRQNVLPVHSQHLGEGSQQVHRLVAHIDDLFVIGEHTLQSDCHDRRRIGIVQDPGVWPVPPGIPDDLDHVGNGPHTIGKAAGAAGLLPHNAVGQRDLLIHQAHIKAAGSDLTENKVHAGIGGFLIRRIEKLQFRIFFPKQDLCEFPNDCLPFTVDIVQPEFFQREFRLLLTQAFQQPRCPRGSTTHDHGLVFFHRRTSQSG